MADAERIRSIENATDHYEDILGTYLTKISRYQIGEDDSAEVSKLLKVIGDFERIADHSVNVLESVEELNAKKIAFSSDAQKELSVLCAAVSEILGMTLDAFVRDDAEAAYDVEPLEQVVDSLKEALRDSHIVRLRNGACTVEAAVRGVLSRIEFFASSPVDFTYIITVMLVMVVQLLLPSVY